MVEFWVLSALSRFVGWVDGDTRPKGCPCGLPVPWLAFCGGCGRRSRAKPARFCGDGCGTCGRSVRDGAQFCHWCGLSAGDER